MTSSYPTSSLPAGCLTYVTSSSSGDPPMKKRRILGTNPFPVGRQVLTVMSCVPALLGNVT